MNIRAIHRATVFSKDSNDPTHGSSCPEIQPFLPPKSFSNSCASTLWLSIDPIRYRAGSLHQSSMFSGSVHAPLSLVRCESLTGRGLAFSGFPTFPLILRDVRTEGVPWLPIVATRVESERGQRFKSASRLHLQPAQQALFAGGGPQTSVFLPTRSPPSQRRSKAATRNKAGIYECGANAPFLKGGRLRRQPVFSCLFTNRSQLSNRWPK